MENQIQKASIVVLLLLLWVRIWQLLNHRYMSRYIYGIDTFNEAEAEAEAETETESESESEAACDILQVMTFLNISKKFCCWLWVGFPN